MTTKSVARGVKEEAATLSVTERQVSTVDIDPALLATLADSFYLTLLIRLMGRFPEEPRLARIAVRPQWLHPRWVWLAQRPELTLEAAGLAGLDLATTVAASPPTATHVTANSPEEPWVRSAIASLSKSVPVSAGDPEAGRPLIPVSASTTTLVHVEQAMQVMSEVWPEAAQEVQKLIRVLVHVGGPVFRSATMPECFGAIFVGPSGVASVVDAFETLLHETGHHDLRLRNTYSLFLRNGTAMAQHPLRPDPRPLDGVVHAAHVLARMATGLDRWSSQPNVPAEVAARRDQAAANLRSTLEVLSKHAVWTSAGELYFRSLKVCSDRLA